MAHRMPPKVLGAFQDFFSMGDSRKRDIRKLAERYRHMDEDERPNITDADLLNWHRQYRWDEEADRLDGILYDSTSALLPRDKIKLIAHRINSIEKVRTMADYVFDEFLSRLSLGIDYLSTMEVAKLVRLMIQAIQTVNAEERLEFGEATSNVAIHTVVEKVVSALPLREEDKVEVRESLIRQINAGEDMDD